MKTADGKKIILFCQKCKRIKPFDGWLPMSAMEQAELAKQNQTKFVQSVCPSCERTR